MTGDTWQIGRFILKFIAISENHQKDWYGHYSTMTFIDVGSLWLWDTHPELSAGVYDGLENYHWIIFSH